MLQMSKSNPNRKESRLPIQRGGRQIAVLTSAAISAAFSA
jgi:hypothetical protein